MDLGLFIAFAIFSGLICALLSRAKSGNGQPMGKRMGVLWIIALLVFMPAFITIPRVKTGYCVALFLVLPVVSIVGWRSRKKDPAQISEPDPDNDGRS